MRLTGACAKVVMAQWSIRVNEILRRNNIEIWLAAGYIDDIRYLTSKISLGWRWSEKSKQLEYREEWQEEEEEERYSLDKKTSLEVGKIMNSVNKDLKFTTEIAEDFSKARLPTLDMEGREARVEILLL